MNYKTPDGNIYAEYTAFPRYTAPCTIVWVCLQTGDKQLRWFDLSQLSEVKSPFETGLLYTCQEPPTYYTVPEKIYPQALWLGIANGILEMSRRKLDIRVAVATSELGVAA